MRWQQGDRVPAVKSVMDKFGILNRIVDRNLAKITAAGAPCTYWRNVSLTKLGALATGNTQCYCWTTPTGGDAQIANPDKQHFLCQGTGFLEGYQRYGYKEFVLGTPTTSLTKSSANLVVTGTRGSTYIMSGNSMTETLTSERYALLNFIAFDHFLVNDKIDADKNRMEYEYSTDDITWTLVTLHDYNVPQIANRYGILSLPAGTSHIRFRIRFKKRTSTATSPSWNSLRFRYRKQVTLREMDPRFPIDVPAFLAAREQQGKAIEEGKEGWTTKFPLEWWTLPDADIMNTDIIAFLQGTYNDYRFEVKNLREMVYGANLQILHKKFESSFIRDKHELLGIVHYLL